MLVLSREAGEAIVIGEGLIRVTVVSVRGGKVRVGIDAPDDIRVDRLEIHELRQQAELGADSAEESELALLES